MSLAGEVSLNVEAGDLHIDGTEFPWDFVGAEPALAEVGDKILPAVQLTIPCANLSTFVPSEMLD